MRKPVWRWLVVALTGHDAQKSNNELESVRKAFDALPKPEEIIPSTIHQVIK